MCPGLGMMNSGRRCAPCPLQATDLVPGSILRKDAELHRTDRKILVQENNCMGWRQLHGGAGRDLIWCSKMRGVLSSGPWDSWLYQYMGKWCQQMDWGSWDGKGHRKDLRDLAS